MKSKIKSYAIGLMLGCLLLPLICPAFLHAEGEEKALKIALITQEPYSVLYGDENGKIGGYCYELLCELGRITGYSYEFVFCSEKEAYEGLTDGTMDLVCGLVEGEIQAANLCASELPVGWYPNVLYGLITEIPEGGIVGTLADNQSQLSYTQMAYATREDTLEALKEGMVQAVLLPGYEIPAGCVRVEMIGMEAFYLACGQENVELMRTMDSALQQLLVKNGGILEQLTLRYLYRNDSKLFYLTQEEQAWLRQSAEVEVLVDDNNEVMQNMTDSLLQELANTLKVDIALKGNQEHIQAQRQAIFLSVLAVFLLCMTMLSIQLWKKNKKIRYYQGQLEEKTDVLYEITKEDGLRELRYFTLDSLTNRIESSSEELAKQFSAEIGVERAYTYPRKLVGDEEKIYQMIRGFTKEIMHTRHGKAMVSIIVRELPEMVIGRLDLEIKIQERWGSDYTAMNYENRRSLERTMALGLLEILGGRIRVSADREHRVQTISLALEKKNYKEKEEVRQKEQQEKIRQAQRAHLDEQRELYESVVTSDGENKNGDFLRGCHILLVDDDEMNRQLETVILESAGAIVHCVGSGKEAISRFRKSEIGFYDKIVMDIVMEGMDGYETVRRIRAMHRADAKTVRIVALSANAGNEDVKESIEAGMDAHCSKPINKHALFKALNS